MPQGSTVFLEKAIKRWTIKRSQEGLYVKDIIAPKQPVDDQSGYFRIYGIEHLTSQLGTSLVGDRGDPPERDYKLSTDTFYCKNRAFKHFIPADVKRLAEQPLRPEQDGAELLVDEHQLEAEIRVRDLVQTLEDSDTTSTDVSIKWDAVGATILEDLMGAKRSVRQGCSRNPNILLVPDHMMEVMLNNDGIQRIIREYRQIDLISGQYPPMILGMNVVVPVALQQTANLALVTAPDTAAVVSDVWAVDSDAAASNNVYLIYSNASPGPRGMNYANQLVWTGFNSKLIHDEMPGASGGDYIKVSNSQDEKIVGTKAAHVLDDLLT